MNVVIRKANIEDLKLVQDLNLKLFQFEYNNFNPSLNMEWTFSAEGETYFKGLIKNGTVWVAVDDHKVIGYLAGSIAKKAYYINQIQAELDNFYIDKEYRRKGIGKKLIKEFKEYCRKQGVEEMIVTASSKNVNAIEFYKSNEFEDFEVTYKTKLK